MVATGVYAQTFILWAQFGKFSNDLFLLFTWPDTGEYPKVHLQMMLAILTSQNIGLVKTYFRTITEPLEIILMRSTSNCLVCRTFSSFGICKMRRQQQRHESRFECTMCIPNNLCQVSASWSQPLFSFLFQASSRVEHSCDSFRVLPT